MKKISLFAFTVLISAFSSAQNKTNWNLNPYEHKVFVENMGQFNGRNNLPASTILYGVDNLGSQVYFTPKGLTYRYDVPNLPAALVEKDHTREEKHKWEEEYKKNFSKDTYLVHMEWLNANPNPKVVSEDVAKEYYNYAKKPGENGVNYVKAYKKITYKELYPGIDVEYVFHKDQGMKYSLVLHPGADITKVKMKYSGNGKVERTAEGNVRINTVIGNIVDHAPITFYEDLSSIKSQFSINDNVVGFELGAYDKSRTVIVDPWTILINLTTTNKAFEISKDASGNVYIYGGNSNFKLQQYSPLGVLNWTFNSAWTNGPTWVGDMITDPSGAAYITSGSCSAIAKVSNAGVGVWIVTPGCTYEYWRMSFNCNYSTLIVSGGTGTGYVSNINMTTGATIGTPPVISSGVEVRGLTLGQNANYYAMSISNLICVSPTFTVNYTVSHGYGFAYSSPTYNGFNTPSGQNIIAVNSKYIYTTNAATLDRRNLATGAIINSAVIPGGVVGSNSGLIVDNCGNVYAGSTLGVYKFDSLLTPLTNQATTGAVYDICIGVGGEVYATGNGFLASLALSVPSCSVNLGLSTTSTGTGCTGGSIGSATASVTGGISPYTYSWSNGQTSQSITGLSNGIYTVTVVDASSCNVATQTVNITGGNLLVSPAQTNVKCAGQNNGAVSLTSSGGKGVYTYSWTPGGQTSSSVTGLSSGTYTVSVTDSTGCSTTQAFTIVQPAAVAVIDSTVNIKCNGQVNGTSTILPSGGTGAFTYLWSNGQTSVTATGLSAGVYTVTVSDANGCSKTHSVIVTEPTILSALSNGNNILCNGQSNGSGSVTASGGSGAYTYLWNNGQTNQSATGLTAGTYTVLVTDNGGCTQTKTITVAQPPLLVVTSSGGTICDGESFNLNAIGSGGTGTITYTWNPGNLVGSSVNVSPNVTTTYTVTATDANGCTKTQTVLVTVNPRPSASFTANPTTGQVPLTIAFTNTSTGGTTYSWIFGDGNTASTFNASNTYTTGGTFNPILIVTNTFGCKDTFMLTVVADALSTLIVPNVFSPNGDGTNDVFVINTVNIKDLFVEIYDRWGLKMGEFNTVTGGWDGKSQSGKDAPEGTYYYILKAHGADSKEYNLKGYLMLLRK